MDTPHQEFSDTGYELMLAGYPGGALVVDGNASVLHSNAKGGGLAALLEHGAAPQISAMVAGCRSTGEIVSQPVSLQSSQGEIVIEVTILPAQDLGKFIVISRDLTMERNLRTALVESRQRYKDLVEVSSDFSWEVDEHGNFSFVTPRGAIGYDADELIDKPAVNFVLDPDFFSPLPFVSKRSIENIEIWMQRKDNKTACMVLSAVPLIANEGGEKVWKGTRGICRDVTLDRENESALARARHREQLLNYIVSTIRDELDPTNMLSAAAAATGQALSVAGCMIFRKSASEGFVRAAEYGNAGDVAILADELSCLDRELPVNSFELGEWNVLAAATSYRQSVNGAITIWKAKSSDDWDDDHRIMISDIANQLGIANEQIANHERIVALSRTDSMTGLLNRRAFFGEEIPRRVTRLMKNNQTAALMYIDMDNFKLVNDVNGHQAGDDAILMLRDMLKEFSRPGDAVARLGGDEFALWMDGISPEVTINRAEQLLARSKCMAEYSGSPEKPLGISVGIAIFDPACAESMDSLVSRADAAMYDVKNSGKGGYSIAPSPEKDSA